MKRMCAVFLVSFVFICGCSSATPLFNGGDLTGWTEIGSKGSWSVRDGMVVCNGKKDTYAWLSSDRKFGDFELTLEWRIEPEGNTGVFLRAPDREGRTSMKGFEVQCKDDRKDKDLSDVCGAVFSRVPATGRHARPPGEWNHLKVTCRGRHVRIEVNGQCSSEFDMDAVKPGTPESMKNVPAEGHIGLQNHGSPAEFRNLMIRLLE